jgi:hypothetical protein
MKIRVKKALGRGVEEELAEMQGKGEKRRNAEIQKCRGSESQVKKAKGRGIMRSGQGQFIWGPPSKPRVRAEKAQT